MLGNIKGFIMYPHANLGNFPKKLQDNADTLRVVLLECNLSIIF